MILILDNNKERRHGIYLSLFIKKYIVSEQALEYMDFYTKPYLTVYLDPTYDDIKKIKKEDTLCVIVKNNVNFPVHDWMVIIPNDKNIAKNIIKIYEERCPYNKGREIIGIMGLEGNLFALGGTFIHLTPKQFKIARLLIYNSEKRFPLYDICHYVDFNTDPEKGFIMMVEDLNLKCRKAGREDLIKCADDKYFISPGVVYY